MEESSIISVIQGESLHGGGENRLESPSGPRMKNRDGLERQDLVSMLLDDSRVASILSLAQATELLAAAAAAQAELVVAAAAQEPEPEVGQPEPEAGSAGSVGVDPMPKERVSEQLRAQQLRCELRDCAVCAGLKGKQVSL